jgi:hypothetical protein
MKYVCFVCLIIGLFCSEGFAQSDKNMIDVEYDFFGSRLQYSVSGKKLFYKDLKLIMENYPEPKTYLEKATRRRNVAVPLLSVGGAGMITSFILRTTDAGAPVFWSSWCIYGWSRLFPRTSCQPPKVCQYLQSKPVQFQSSEK